MLVLIEGENSLDAQIHVNYNYICDGLTINIHIYIIYILHVFASVFAYTLVNLKAINT